MVNLDKVNIPKRLINKLEEIFCSFDKLEKVVLFGSRARKDNKEYSDIDLAFYGISDDKLSLINKIESLDTLYSFDLIFVDTNISKALISNIEKEGCVVYKGNILDRRKIRFKSLKETYTKLTEAINEDKDKNDSIGKC